MPQRVMDSASLCIAGSPLTLSFEYLVKCCTALLLIVRGQRMPVHLHACRGRRQPWARCALGQQEPQVSPLPQPVNTINALLLTSQAQRRPDRSSSRSLRVWPPRAV